MNSSAFTSTTPPPPASIPVTLPVPGTDPTLLRMILEFLFRALGLLPPRRPEDPPFTSLEQVRDAALTASPSPTLLAEINSRYQAAIAGKITVSCP